MNKAEASTVITTVELLRVEPTKVLLLLNSHYMLI